jgi:hypothetical protein
VASGAPVVSIGLEASNEEDVVDAHVVVLLLDFFFFGSCPEEPGAGLTFAEIRPVAVDVDGALGSSGLTTADSY